MGESCNAVAKRFDVAPSTVVKLKQHEKATGSLAPKRMGGYRKHKLAAHDAVLRELLQATPDVTLEELGVELGKRRIGTSRSGFDRHLKHIAWSYRKTLRASEQNRPNVKAARDVWREAQPVLKVSKLVFIDESGFTTNMVRTHGRSPIGQRLPAKAPHGHRHTTTFIAALRRDRLSAPMTLDGPINGETFKAWTEQFLAPALKRGDIVVMDNLPSHKVLGIREAIAARKATLLYLPPYSPDLNPIEQVFAKFKSALRKAAARTVPKLWCAIAKTLKTFSPQECANYLRNCGYPN